MRKVAFIPLVIFFLVPAFAVAATSHPGQ